VGSWPEHPGERGGLCRDWRNSEKMVFVNHVVLKPLLCMYRVLEMISYAGGRELDSQRSTYCREGFDKSA